VEDGDPILIDIPRRRIELLVDEIVLNGRRAHWRPPEPKIAKGYLARYASMVTSGSTGAVLELGS
jgi:dihydroxy-acid dehydratase